MRVLLTRGPFAVVFKRAHWSKIENADKRRLVLEVLRWETDAVPGIGRAQELINPMLARVDVVIGILATRFGTPTGVAGSGTQEEFDLAYDSWSRSGRPRIMFYFKSRSTVFRTTEQVDQMGKVLEFRDRLGKTALYWEFTSTHEFEVAVRQHLTLLILEGTA